MAAEQTAHGLLCAAVGKVMLQVGAIKKTGQNRHGGYSYASDADLAYALQPAMAEHGLALMPVGQAIEHFDNSAHSKMKHRVIIVTTWRLQHVGGGYIELQTIGEGADSLDKATYKAQTGALKYALRQLFLVPTGDDPERDARNVAPEPTKADAPATWKQNERGAFCARLGEYGISYDDLKAYCLAHGKDKPSSGSAAYRKKLLQVLEDPKGDARVKLDEWLGKMLDEAGGL